MLTPRVLGAVAATILLVACSTPTGSTPTGGDAPGPSLFPASGATNVNPDTHLQLTFDAPPAIGSSGLVRIYDTASGDLVDTLDMSIPASPNPDGRSRASTEAERQAMARALKMEDYQTDTIGGVQIHVFPVIVRGNTATIYPHQGRLAYGRTYRVEIDAPVLTAGAETAATTSWTFATKSAPPPASATRLTVDASGRGDFNTVQGAVDFVADNPASPVEIFLRNGRYEEPVFITNKSNLTFRGESRDGVVVTYPNNSAFNPPRGGPSKRPAFSVNDSNAIQLSTFTIRNTFIGQAEALLMRGERNIVDRMTLDGSGDAFTTYGSIYMVDSSLKGDGDTILGYASLYCLRCEISSRGPFTWTRTPEGRHGNVFMDSTFIYLDEPMPWTVSAANPAGQKSSSTLARLPRNGPGSSAPNFPHAEMVLIDSRTKGVIPERFGPVEDRETFDWTNVRLMEANTTDLEGHPIDMSQRHPIVKVLDPVKDAETIASYRKPEFVLGGWKPVVR